MEQGIDLKPHINYPREAHAGHTYILSINVEVAHKERPWPYPEEEYPISVILETEPFFHHEPLDADEQAVVLHRGGGTYGPARYLLTATTQIVGPAQIHITFVNQAGLPIGHVALSCVITPSPLPPSTKQRKRKSI